LGKGRLEAFSDGVIAILITIMVLELGIPQGKGLGALHDKWPALFVYALSFVTLAIYWNNHHHLLSAAERINGKILWANMHLLFWLSLIPFTTGWTGENHFAKVPVSAYGIVLLLAAFAYYLLQTSIVREHGRDSMIARALGNDFKGKISPTLYAAAVPLAFVNRFIALGIYYFVAAIWLIPDRRIESIFRTEE